MAKMFRKANLNVVISDLKEENLNKLGTFIQTPIEKP